MAINGIALAAGATGAVFLWSALENKGILATVKSVVSGQKPTPGPEAATQASTGSTSTAPAAPVSVTGNVATGKMLAAGFGWGSGAQWDALYALWERESGWSNTAQNPTSGAYGIPQSLPASKMGVAANPPTSSPTAQIEWGLSYIEGTYGTPVNAWAHETEYGWY